NGLLCEHQDRPLDKARFERTHEALRELAVRDAYCRIPGTDTPGGCRVCGFVWKYGDDETHDPSCSAQPLALEDPHHNCGFGEYKYCRCGKFLDPRKK
ncbi:unnamed protein product, partial [marine sediment metagenome]